MGKYFTKSLWLLGFAVVICCGVYPAVLWVIGQVFFNEQANGSLLTGPDGKVVGSKLIAQPFTKDEYFQPRPSAVSYDASASGPSNLSASNYLLRDRVAKILGPIAKYADGPKAGQPVAPDVEAWFQKDMYQGAPHLVAQWADAHNAVAQAWVSGDPLHGGYVDAWMKEHPNEVAQWIKDNPGTPEPKNTDLAVVFFEDFSKKNPGMFPSAVDEPTADGKTQSVIKPVKEGADIQSTFFDMWRTEHPDVALQQVPADMVMASGSGLDPHISLANATFQLERVAGKWADDLHRDPADVRKEIQQILDQNVSAPWGGLIGEKYVNVLELNLELRKRFGAPPA
ncbi:MAG TPA: potassium transporter [Deltaproteobacteria bacterium]|nr:potassium transporter [Deltaproteobacteria bacterium]